MTRVVGARLAAFGCAAVIVLAACSDDEEPSAQPPTSASATPTPTPTPSVPITPAPTPAPEPEPRTFTLVATGDVLLHERLWFQAERDAGDDGTWNFAPQLGHIKPVVKGADLAICHMETPLAPEGGPFAGYPLFSGPPQIVPALVDTGYDACTTASNHTFDRGADGVERTLDALDDAGLEHAGSARTKAEAEKTTIVDVETPQGAVDVALISFTYSFNGLPFPGGDTWRSNLIDKDEILDDAAAARKEGADVVIVALHWGTEYVHEPDEQQRALAPELIGSPDIDLLLGHHAHVVQPIENIDGEWVVYGMGNLMANHAEPQSAKSEGLLVRLTFTEDVDDGSFDATAAEYLPLYQTYDPPVEVLAVPLALDSGKVGTAGKARLAEARERTVSIVESRGGKQAGLEMIGAG